jgi:hypothetical protein
VEAAASASMSNALSDLYAMELDRQLNIHQASVEQRLRHDLEGHFIRREDFWDVFFHSIWSRLVAAIIFIAVVGAFVFTILQYVDNTSSSDSNGGEGNGAGINQASDKP